MTKFLAIQNSYHDIQIALFENAHIIDARQTDKIQASKMLIPLFNDLLDKNSLALSQLNFIAANIGPGPYTTLRTVLASVNGLSFATQLPLIGVDSLDAMVHEYQTSDSSLIVLLNAFNQDVYFAIRSPNDEIQKGCMSINSFLAHIAQTIPHETLRFVGNGTSMHQDVIQNTFGPRALLTDPIPEGPSIEVIGALALEKGERSEGLERQLMPIYLK